MLEFIIPIALSVVLPDALLIAVDKYYEKWKEEHGYKNKYLKKSLFKEDRDFSPLMRRIGAISLFLPGVNLITSYVLMYRRVQGITLNHEIKAGAVELDEGPIVITEDEIEVIDTKDIPNDSDTQGRKSIDEEENLDELLSQILGAANEDHELADLLGELMFASVLAGVMGHMGASQMEFYQNPEPPKPDESEDPYEFLKEFFKDDKNQQNGPRLRK